MMCFTGALQFAKKDNSGEVLGVVNTFNMLGGALLQQLIGYILDYRWQGVYNATGQRFYNTAEFTYALSYITIVIIGCVILSYFLRYNRSPEQL